MAQIKHNLHPVGEVKPDIHEELSYFTERDKHKNQIYLYKTLFYSADKKDKYEGLNCIGISLNICKELLFKNVKNVYFILKNYPQDMQHQIKKIELNNFLSKSITIKENGYDEQRIIGMEEL